MFLTPTNGLIPTGIQWPIVWYNDSRCLSHESVRDQACVTTLYIFYSHQILGDGIPEVIFHVTYQGLSSGCSCILSVGFITGL